jgi:carbamoylphosphate synthase large subunit
MIEYKNVLLGKNICFPDWKASLNKINKPNVVFCDFNDLKNIKEIILHKNITYIIPFSEMDYKLIKSYTDAGYLDNTLKILYPSEETFNLLNNKNAFTEFMLDHFIANIPEIYYLNNVKRKHIKYPAISKPIYSTNGSNMTIIYNNTDFGKLENWKIATTYKNL